MRVFSLKSAFLLCLLLGGQVLFLPGMANADCCGCGMCWPWMCDCAGVGSCPYCSTDESTSPQSNASTYKSAADFRAAPSSVPSTAWKSDVTEKVMEQTIGRKCFRDKVALSLLGNTRDGMKFNSLRFDEAVNRENVLAFQTIVNSEK